MNVNLSNKRIKCTVCGKEYGLNELHCPKCSYPALSFSNKAAKAAVRIDNYKLKKGYKKQESKTNSKATAHSNKTVKKTQTPNKAKPSNTQTTGTKGSSVKQSAPLNRKQPVKANNYNNSNQKTKHPWLIVLVVIIGIVGLIRYIDSNKPDDTTPSDVTETETVDDTTDTSAVTDNAEDAFQQFIDDTIANADEYDGGHPVYYDSNGGDPITWEAYGIEDFDGDGEIELLALRSFYRIGGKLTLYEYESGNVHEGRSSWFLGGLEELQNVWFYSNGVGFRYEGVIDTGSTEYVYLFNDKYTSTYDVDSEQYLIFSHAEDGSIGFNTGPDYKGDDKIMSQSEYEDFTLQLHRDEEYASYWMLNPEFNEITH